MLPAFASLDDLDERLPGGLEGVDVARAQAALEDAASLIRAETGKSYVDDVGSLALPTGDNAWRADTLTRVNLSVAVRAVTNPDGVSEQQIVNYRETLANASPDVYLTASERRSVRRAAGILGLAAVSTTRGPCLETPGPPIRCRGAETYLEVEPAGEPIPWE